LSQILFSADSESFASIERFSINDGLPDTTIFSIGRDKSEFIWLGTPSGLARYDNHEFRKYSNTPDSVYPMPLGQSRQIFIDSKGRHWVGY